MPELSLFQPLVNTCIQNTCIQSEVNFSVAPPDDVTCVHRIYRYQIADEMLDQDAVRVVRRLDRFGHESYLVGGSIRDILFGVHPKDFDIATSALPSEVRREFRNCRLIGRRFRLAHLLFRENKVIEVATFRRGATSEDDISCQHAAENLFGGPADDAIRRDFTINALMYDVGRREIHDYVGGIEDIKAKLLNTIGDPVRRFKEDPVRIIRAAKFAERLNLTMHPKVEEAARELAPLIADCSKARLVEELFKILRTGKSARCLSALDQLGVLKILMPKLAERCADTSSNFWQLLENADKIVKSGKHLSEAVMLSAMIYPCVENLFDEKGDLASKIHVLFHELIFPIPIPKRCGAAVRQIITAQKKLNAGPNRARAKRFLDREYASEAIDFMEILSANNDSLEIYNEWMHLISKQKRQKQSNTSVRIKHPRKSRKGNKSLVDLPDRTTTPEV